MFLAIFALFDLSTPLCYNYVMVHLHVLSYKELTMTEDLELNWPRIGLTILATSIVVFGFRKIYKFFKAK
jgi:hypothetical protein